MFMPVWTVVQSTFPAHLMVLELIGKWDYNLASAIAPVIIGVLIQISGSYGVGLMYLTAFGILGALAV